MTTPVGLAEAAAVLRRAVVPADGCDGEARGLRLVQGHHHRQDQRPTSRHRRRRRVNFLAKFDIDQGRSTDLSLEASMYDTSTSADYESWLLFWRRCRRNRLELDTVYRCEGVACLYFIYSTVGL